MQKKQVVKVLEQKIGRKTGFTFLVVGGALENGYR